MSDYHCCVCGDELGDDKDEWAYAIIGCNGPEFDHQYFPVHDRCLNELPPINYCAVCAEWRFWADTTKRYR